jgi:AraC-like DNA-binding protein
MTQVAILSALKLKLRQATSDLSTRGLHFSSKFASEQLLGLADLQDLEQCFPHSRFDDETSNHLYNDLLMFSKSLLTLGEFQRCAYLIRSKTQNLFSPATKVTRLIQELRFIAAYSLYMVTLLNIPLNRCHFVNIQFVGWREKQK